MAKQALGERMSALESQLSLLRILGEHEVATPPVQATPVDVKPDVKPSMGQVTGKGGIVMRVPSNVEPGVFLVKLVTGYCAKHHVTSMPANKSAVDGHGVFWFWNQYFRQHLAKDNPNVDAASALAMVRKSLVSQGLITYTRGIEINGEKCNVYAIGTGSAPIKAVAPKATAVPEWAKGLF